MHWSEQLALILRDTPFPWLAFSAAEMLQNTYQQLDSWLHITALVTSLSQTIAKWTLTVYRDFWHLVVSFSVAYHSGPKTDFADICSRSMLFQTSHLAGSYPERPPMMNMATQTDSTYARLFHYIDPGRLISPAPTQFLTRVLRRTISKPLMQLSDKFYEAMNGRIIIRLDVGGIPFTTTLDTLTCIQDSRLSRAFLKLFNPSVNLSHEDFEISKLSDGSYFIDRDGKCVDSLVGISFYYIIQYLRRMNKDPDPFHHSIPELDICLSEMKDLTMLSLLIDECEFYGLNQLEQLLLRGKDKIILQKRLGFFYPILETAGLVTKRTIQETLHLMVGISSYPSCQCTPRRMSRYFHDIYSEFVEWLAEEDILHTLAAISVLFSFLWVILK
jgi:hypothetical protein